MGSDHRVDESRPPSAEPDGTEAHSWPARHNTVLTVGAASVAPIIQLLFINRYAVNSFFFDCNPPIRLIGAAIHGQLTVNQLWKQFGQGRQFLMNIIFVVFGLTNRAEVRSILFFSAVLYIASFVLLLALFRRYLRRRLTPIPVLILGLVWFSLANLGNSLFPYQLSLYLVVFSVMVMVFALTVPDKRRGLWLAIAALAATAASLSFLNGLLAWPLGALCILWCQPWSRRMLRDISIWIASAVVLGAIYFHEYKGADTGCGFGQPCSVGNSLGQPVQLVRVFLTLIGGVIPGGTVMPRFVNGSYANQPLISSTPFELIGAVLLGASLFIIVQSFRYRSTRERVPIPMIMICFALSWDAVTALGRTALGPSYIAIVNRYMLPNIILLTAIVMYALAHIPPLRVARTHLTRRLCVSYAALLVLACFVVVQIAASTSFALQHAPAVRESFVMSARLWVNLDRVPARYRECEIRLVINFNTFSAPLPPQAARDQLGQFRPGSYRHFRKLGPPPLSPICTRLGNVPAAPDAIAPP